MKKVLVLLLWLTFLSGCAILNSKSAIPFERFKDYERIGFYGFLTPRLASEGIHLIREPIGGTYHYAQKVPDEVIQEMEQLVWNELRRRNIKDLLFVDQLKASFLAELERDRTFDIKTLIFKSGEESGLDAIIIGHLYRFKEREGSDFAVSTPASVSFDLHLLDIQKREVVSRYTVDIEQKSLSENLLGIGQLTKSGFRWAKASTLARQGVVEALDYLLGPIITRSRDE